MAEGKTSPRPQLSPRAVVTFQSLSCVQLFVTPRAAAHQASLSYTVSRSLLKPMSIESMMPSNHLLLCHPHLLLPSVFPSIRVFYNELALHIRWPKYWSFSSVQFSLVAQWCLTLCDPMNRSTPGLPVHHQLPEFTQTHVHRW